MIKKEIKPIVISYGYEKDKDSMVFISLGKEIKIKNCNNELKMILPLCNGINTNRDILNKTKNSIVKSDAEKIISTLFLYKIIVDPTYFYNIFHEVSKNPMIFHPNINSRRVRYLYNEARKTKNCKNFEVTKAKIKETDLIKIIKKRKSTRSFSRSRIINFEELSGLAWATLGSYQRSPSINSYTIPSGGGLYPTEQYFILLKDNNVFKKGIYFWDKNSNKFLLVNNVISKSKLNLIFDNNLIKSSLAIQVITSKIPRLTEKYSNRGYRYALIEIGHAAQNSYLFCAENNLSAVEYGGFIDDKLSDFIGINSNEELPVICMILGK